MHSDTQWILGIPFFKNYYTIFNEDIQQVGFGVSVSSNATIVKDSTHPANTNLLPNIEPITLDIIKSLPILFSTLGGVAGVSTIAIVIALMYN